MGVISRCYFSFYGGFASGSFYIPYKKVKGWAWESYWIVGGLFSWLDCSALGGLSDHPGFCRNHQGSTGTSTLGITYLFGVLMGYWRVDLWFGCSLSWCFSWVAVSFLGLCMVFGALIPSIYYDFYPDEGKDTFSMMVGSQLGTYCFGRSCSLCCRNYYLR